MILEASEPSAHSRWADSKFIGLLAGTGEGVVGRGWGWGSRWLSWGHRWAGEQVRAARRLQAAEGVGGAGRQHLAGAAHHVAVVELPQQLLVLHGQTLVDLGLLLQGLLQHRLLRRQLP